jgi:hypothetical protein
MLPPWFPEFIEYFFVPVGVLLLAYGVNDFRLKYSSGSDFFVFFVSLDLNALVVYNAYKDRVNPSFTDDYLSVFVCLTLICVILLVWTLKTQRKIDDWRLGRTPRTSYPLGSVIGSWVATGVFISTHLYIFFGKG